MVRPIEKPRVARIALAGNPNTGKSTVFNRLTGLRQRIANYPGITVEAKVGNAVLGGKTVEMIDLPGSYSLSAETIDERVMLDFLTGHAGPELDLLVCVLDATNLERNLFLPFQAADFGVPMILVLNQWDIARRKGVAVEPGELSKRLGVPVLPVSGRTGEGFEELSKAIAGALEKPSFLAPTPWRAEVLRAKDRLRELLPGISDGVALRLLFDPRSALLEKWPDRREEIRAVVGEGRAELAAAGINPGPAEAVLQYDRIREILAGVTPDPENEVAASSESIDRLLLHRFWGTVVFFAVMWVVFQSVYSWAGPVMDGLDAATGALQEAVRPALAGAPVLESLVVDGIIAGVGGVVIFLPQIFVLFFFIGLLEDTGYMARAAFLMDKALGWCGLNGKSFVPLLSSYACSIPGIMAARTMENRWARTATILMSPFMSCSARLPVYVLLIGAFIEPRFGAMAAGWTLFFLHFVGLLVAAPLAWVVHRFFSPSSVQPFVLEMPRYKVPQIRGLLLRMWENGREFLVRAGTVILAFSVIIWALLYFPRDDAVEERVTETMVAEVAAEGALSPEAALARIRTQGTPLAAEFERRVEAAWLADSYLGRFGHWVQPVFAPAGFDWKITVGVISSFPAREVIISTLGIIYQLGPEVDEETVGLREKLAAERWPAGPLQGTPVFTLPVVFAVLVFFALCLQCGATVAVIAKELTWGYAIASFVGMTVLAWVSAVAVYQIGSLL